MSTWAEEKTLVEMLTELRRANALLERIANAIERQKTDSLPVERFVEGKCIYCGGFHGGGLPCPLLAPNGSL